MTMAEVAAPDGFEEAVICINALQAAGFHPLAGWSGATPGAAQGQQRPTRFPVLAPDAEADDARAYLESLRSDPAEDPDDPPPTLRERLSDAVPLALYFCLALAAFAGFALLMQPHTHVYFH